MTTVSVKLRRNLDHLTRSLLLKPSSVESNKPSDISLTSFEVKDELLKSEEHVFLKELDEHILDDAETFQGIPPHSRRANLLRRCSTCCKICVLNKAAVSLWFTLFLIFVALVLLIPERILIENAGRNNESLSSRSDISSVTLASRYFLNMGLVGFMSGLTNLFANLLLFYGIPCIPGCAVVQRRYKEIKWIIKEVVLNLLFESEFLERYITQELQKASTNIKIEESIKTAVNSRDVELLVLAHLSEIYEEPEGYFLKEMGLKHDVLYSLVKPFVLMLCAEAAPLVLQELSESQQTIGGDQLREEMDKFLSWRTDSLTKKKLRKVLFDLIFKELDWIVMWGCIVGVIFGIISKSIGVSAL